MRPWQTRDGETRAAVFVLAEAKSWRRGGGRPGARASLEDGDCRHVQAEHIASKMISDGRMSATVDQVDSLIIFQGASEALVVWDEAIARLCHMTEHVVQRIATKHPDILRSAAAAANR